MKAQTLLRRELGRVAVEHLILVVVAQARAIEPASPPRLRCGNHR